MNFFFFALAPGIKSSLTIARFQNSGLSAADDAKLWSATPHDGQWSVNLAECEEAADFWKVTATEETRHHVYFIATEGELENSGWFSDGLTELNEFTNTAPDYRANLRVYNNRGGFSSYQSEFPTKMIDRRGDLLSPILTLANPTAEKNIIFIRNVFKEPIREPYKAYIVNKSNSKVEAEYDIYSNSTNFIELSKDLIGPDMYIYCKGFLSIPVYLSEARDGHLSFEHTHPPHSNVSGPQTHTLVRSYKTEVARIVESRDKNHA